MGGDEQLGARAGLATFLSQSVQQPRVQKILRFFDTDEGRRSSIVTPEAATPLLAKSNSINSSTRSSRPTRSTIRIVQQH